LIRGDVAPIRRLIPMCASVVPDLTDSISLRPCLIATITLLIATCADFVSVLTRSVSLLGSLVALTALGVIVGDEWWL
jgi:hypothetical protein